MINLSNSELYQLIPINLRDDEDIIAAARAVDKSTQSIYSLANKLDFHSNSDIQDNKILDALAVDLHVDFYDKNLPPKLKQEIIDSSMLLHMIKGTAGAVEKALASVDLKGVVSEWFEYGGTPFFFRIEVDKSFKTNEDLSRIVDIVNSTKNRRSSLEEVLIKRSLESNQYFAGFINQWTQATIDTIQFSMPNIAGNQQTSGYISTWKKHTIYPEVKHKWLITGEYY